MFTKTKEFIHKRDDIVITVENRGSSFNFKTNFHWSTPASIDISPIRKKIQVGAGCGGFNNDVSPIKKAEVMIFVWEMVRHYAEILEEELDNLPVEV